MLLPALALAASAVTSAFAGETLSTRSVWAEPNLQSTCLAGVYTSAHDINSTVVDFCDSFSKSGIRLQGGAGYNSSNVYCDEERCIVLYVWYNGQNLDGTASQGSMSYAECRSYFWLYPAEHRNITSGMPIKDCRQGLYVGSSYGPWIWSVATVITLPGASADPPPMSPHFSDLSVHTDLTRRQTWTQEISCYDDSAVKTDYTDFENIIIGFCSLPPQTISADETISLQNCTSERCIELSTKYSSAGQPTPYDISRYQCLGFFLPIIGQDCGPTTGTFGGGQDNIESGLWLYTATVSEGHSVDMTPSKPR